MKWLLLLIPTLCWAQTDSVFNRALETHQITKIEARNLYLLKERAQGGSKVQVFRLPLRDPLHAEFVRDVLRMDPSDFDKEWMKLVNAGLAPQIVQAVDQREMLYLVSRYPGGIGYLSHSYMVLNGRGSDAVIVRIVN